MQCILYLVTTARIILHLWITAANPVANGGSVLLSDEYMKHASQIVFQGTQNSETPSIELQPRGSPQDSKPRAEAKDYTVVNPYMI